MGSQVLGICRRRQFGPPFCTISAHQASVPEVLQDPSGSPKKWIKASSFSVFREESQPLSRLLPHRLEGLRVDPQFPKET